MNAKVRFYDTYHQKNNKYHSVIRRNNFTYFYILQFLHSHDINRFGTMRKVLDIGCGVGTMSLYLASLGAEVTGIDISERAISLSKDAQKSLGIKNVSFHHGDITAARGIFDLVICLEVIEHIEDDGKMLDEIRSHLKKGGRLFLSTPSRENVLYTLGFYKKFDTEVGHCRRYTMDELHTLVSHHGFQVIAQKKVESPLRNILFTTKLGFLIRFIKGPLIPLFHFFDMLLIPVFGASDLMIMAERT